MTTHLRNLEARELLVSHKEDRWLYDRPVVDELERQFLERRYDLQAHERPKQKRRSGAS